MKPRFAIIVSRFNEHVTSKLLEGALAFSKTVGVTPKVVWVPGAFEIPVVAKQLAQKGNVDGMACLGCVIRGETDHYDLITKETARGVAQVSLDFSIPIAFEVLCVHHAAQALERAGGKMGNRGEDAMRVLWEMAELWEQEGWRGNVR